MTILVGILNKQGVAIAADSAVTHGRGPNRKVINNAEKMFRLSEHHPIALMVYDNASFMGVSWEIIIKEYRKDLGERYFAHTTDYIDNFIHFLHKRNFFCDDETQLEMLYEMLTYYYGYTVMKYLSPEIDEETKKQRTEEILLDAIEICKGIPKCYEFEHYKYDEFCKYSKECIEHFCNEFKVHCKDLLTEAFYQFLIKIFDLEFCTGLVFVGYGEDEIYPSMITLKVSIVVDKRLRFYVEDGKSTKISEHGTLCDIIPFAQDEMIHTMIDGCHPEFERIMVDEVTRAMEHYCSQVVKVLDKGKANKELYKAIKSIDIDEIVQQVRSNMRECVLRNHKGPMLGVISGLDIQSMANFAESMVSITCDVRKVQKEMETVGGPIDVAVISKGDGFVWIKKKNYINLELNPNYLYNRLKK